MGQRQSIRTFVLAFLCAITTVCPLPRGRVMGAEPTDEHVDRMVATLIEKLRSAQHTEPGSAFGSFQGERSDLHKGGVTALATYALLASGVPWHDATITNALAFLAEQPMDSTYSRALRASVYANLAVRAGDPKLRSRAQLLLQKDTDWLVQALKADGYYGYTLDGLGGDHSCSQFGVLGVWTAENSGGEVPSDYWRRIREHWLAAQLDDGGWAYSGRQGATPTMTTGGVNTLYVLLSQYHARKEPAYLLWRGVRRTGTASKELAQTAAAIDSGLDWLSSGDLFARGTYQLFGLERLGVAAGRKYIGSADWYREGVQRVSTGGSTVDRAFTLLFLTYGRAPVLVNKLQYGPDDDWNNYYRDLHWITQWMSAKHEVIYKWQSVPASSELHDYLDAPILLISGGSYFGVTYDQQQRLIDFIDRGGTVLAHADRGSESYAQSVRELFRSLFAERGWQFDKLPADHGLYRAHHKPEDGWPERLAIEGMNDSLRTCVFLVSADVAGAWHQNRYRQHPELFELAGNLRVYAAPKYEHLPKRLRPLDGSSDALPVGWLALGPALPSDKMTWRPWAFRGVSQETADANGIVPVTLPYELAEAADVMVVHGPGSIDFDDENVTHVVQRMRTGVPLLIESSGASGDFYEPAKRLMDALAEHLETAWSPIDDQHALLRGGVPGSAPVESISPNRWATRAMRSQVPPVSVLHADGFAPAVFVPFDLIASGGGHYVFEAAAYDLPESRQMAVNLLATLYEHVAKDLPVSPLAGRPRKRPVAPLMELAEAALSERDNTTAQQLLEAARRIDPKRETARQLLDDVEQKKKEQATSLPGDEVATAASERQSRKGRTAMERKIAALESFAERLPDALDGVVLDFNGKQHSARKLLREWIRWKIEMIEVQQDTRELKSRDEILQIRAREARQGRTDDRGRNPRLEAIAAERKAISDEMQENYATMERLQSRLSQLNHRLEVAADELGKAGVNYKHGEWRLAE